MIKNAFCSEFHRKYRVKYLEKQQKIGILVKNNRFKGVFTQKNGYF